MMGMGGRGRIKRVIAAATRDQLKCWSKAARCSPGRITPGLHPGNQKRCEKGRRFLTGSIKLSGSLDLLPKKGDTEERGEETRKKYQSTFTKSSSL
ncbi:hypothetical protein AV530_009340 [Patagioenas fasciata monilis]|uniref:Uncharacterized protein n=1 Tax=Patagioenas fasciata monilis TaxID=372326 RepID=A0A1V4JIK1_PATFA|nr:hypothetical protein AV530_009340 [Patagioenas fasciata monilis]